MKRKESKSQRSILAIDPGEHCGYAWFGPDPINHTAMILDHGVWNLKGDWPKRLHDLNEEIHRLIKPDVVAVEKIAEGSWTKGHANLHHLQRYIGVVMGAAYPVPVIEVYPQQWKAALGLPVGAKADQYLPAVKRIWASVAPGIAVASPDEAAALGILWWAKSRLKKEGLI